MHEKKYTKNTKAWAKAGFATTKKKLKYRSTPQGLQLHKKKRKKEKTEAPKGFALQKLIKTPAPRKDCNCRNTEAPRRVCNCRDTPRGVRVAKVVDLYSGP